MITQSQDFNHQHNRRWRIGRIALAICLLILVLAVATFLSGRTAGTELIKKYPAPGQLVDVDGHQMHLNCLGEGTPTVILEAGLGGFSVDWSLVQPEIAKFSRVCAYDRAGYGWSEPGPDPRTSETAVKELHALLAAAGVEKPYLLVGHSFGGLISRLYAHTYPDEVTGVVLVDAVHEEQDIRLPAYGQAGAQLAKQFRLLALLRKLGIVSLFPEKIPNPGLPEEAFARYGAILATTPYFETSNAESLVLPRSLAEYRAIPDPSLGDLPLIVLSRGLGMPLPGLSQAENEQNEQKWQEMQAELASLSTNSRQLIAANSGHSIALQQPELVVEAVRQLIGQKQTAAQPPAPTNTVASLSSKPSAGKANCNAHCWNHHQPRLPPRPTSTPTSSTTGRGRIYAADHLS